MVNILDHLKSRKGIRNLGDFNLSEVESMVQTPSQEFEVFEFVELRMSAEKFEKEYEKEIEKRVSKDLAPFTIEEVTKEYIPRIERLYENARNTSQANFRKLNTRAFEKLIDHSLSHFLILIVDGVDAGFIFVEIDEKNQTHGYISGLGIEPEFKRKGLGSILAVHAFRKYFKGVVEELVCEVYYRNEASFKFITSMGFEIYDED